MTADANDGAEALAAALGRLAPRLCAGGRLIERLVRLSGGATQELWQFDIVGDGAAAFVLRRSREGAADPDQGFPLDREAELIVAAARVGVPVAAVAHVLVPEDGLGTGFVMAHCDGETLGGRIVRSAALAPAREVLAAQCGDALARIHSVDPSAFPWLPRHDTAGWVDHWRAIHRRASVPRPVFELAFRWLDERLPPEPARPALVHGDFRIGNLMVGPEGIRAVLDWELAHVGDPMEDLGWLCINSWRFGRIDRPVGGVGGREDLYAAWEQRRGERVDRAVAHWWEVYGTLRWGVICAGGLATYRGTDPSAERAMIARRTSETEIDLLRLIAD